MKTNSPVFYVTQYISKGKSCQYRTKSLTDFHAHIRETFPGSRTLKFDPTVKWPFGMYAEVVAQS